MDPSLPTLSKSRYLAGLQCPKRLWLEVHRRDLLPSAPGAAQQALFDAGNEVGILARQKWPGGVLVAEDYRHHAEAVEATRRAMADPAVPAVFEAAFTHAGVRVRVDVLARSDNADGTWDLVEVKATASVKDVHAPDVAVQAYVLLGCGVQLRRAGILHLDTDYVLGDDGLDLDGLFAFEDLLPRLGDSLAKVPGRLALLHDVVALGDAPEVETGDHCYAPYECPFTQLCVTPPGRYDVGLLPRSARLVAEMAEVGVSDVRRIPEGTKLSPTQARMVRCVVEEREHVGADLPKALSAFEFPLVFLDFESAAFPIPR